MIRMMLMIILITVSATQMRSPSPSRRSRLVQLNPPITASQGYRPSCDAAVCGVLAPVTLLLQEGEDDLGVTATRVTADGSCCKP